MMSMRVIINYLFLFVNYHVNYVTYLNNQGVNVTGRLINYDELIALGCTTSYSYLSGPKWVYQTTYWSGSVGLYDNLWSVNTNGYFSYGRYSYSTVKGVRPVIILQI